MTMDLEACLSRIGYEGPREPDLATLAALQEAFLRTVPFENLDIHLGRPIVLETERFYAKIVDERRGGFCYECNGLFHAMLGAMGFEVRYLAAAMLLERSVPMDFGHMVLLVRLDGDYLVDVGNGQSCLVPLRLDGGRASSEGIEYEVRPYDGGHALFYREGGGEWKPRYRFTTTSRELPEFTGLCRWHQTSPRSRFTRHRLATIAANGGRVTLVDTELTVAEGKTQRVKRLTGAAEYGAALQSS
ncbi:MAG: arylamine N-acetyltransferase [Gammaproteobacteria bacterium]